MIQNRPDWCISASGPGRSIVAFTCTSAASADRRAPGRTRVRFSSKKGSRCLFDLSVKELLPPGTHCRNARAKNSPKRPYPGCLVRLRSELRGGLRKKAQPEIPRRHVPRGKRSAPGWFHSSLLASLEPGQAPTTRSSPRIRGGREGERCPSPGNVIVRRGDQEVRAPRSSACGWRRGLRDDIRISEEILSRLSDAYRRIRNTCRFLWTCTISTREGLVPIPGSRTWTGGSPSFAETDFRLREPMRIRISHGLSRIHNFCSVDLSALYLIS